MQSYIRLMDGGIYPVDHAAELHNGRLVINVLNMKFMTAYSLFSDANRITKIAYGDGKRETFFEGYTIIESISEDDMGGVHIWLRKE